MCVQALGGAVPSGILETPSAQLLNLIQSSQSGKKMVEGCFENFLSVRGIGTFDPQLKKAGHVNDWLGFYDTCEKHINTHQNYSLMRYTPFVGLAFNHEYASTDKQYLKFPQSSWKCMDLTKTHTAIVHTMLEDAAPRIRRMMSVDVVVIDLISTFLDVLTPSIRPVAPALLNVQEKSTLKAVVETMVAYNVSFKQVRNMDQSYVPPT